MSNPDPIPVYIGDDWSFAFSYRESGGNGAPVDLTGTSIVCALFYPGSAVPVNLTESSGQTGLIEPENGTFGIGVGRNITSGFLTSATPFAACLAIGVSKANLQRTIGVWPLLLLNKRTPLVAPLVNLQTVDPINGNVLHFDGLTEIVPTMIAGVLQFDFSQPSNSIALVI